MAEKAGFVGLGNIGNPTPRNVLKAGFPLVVYGVNPAAIDSGSAGVEPERYQAVWGVGRRREPGHVSLCSG